MQAVRSGLRDGVDDAANRPAKLGRVDTRVHLELADHCLRCGVSGAGTSALFREECLVVVRTVDLDIVKGGCNRAELQQAIAAGIDGDARRGQGQRGPAAIVDRNVLDVPVAQVTTEVRRLEVDCRDISRHLHRAARSARCKVRIQFCYFLHLDNNTGRALR